MSDPKQPPALVRKWEGLEMGIQFVIAWPVLSVVIAFIHWTALTQPLWRGLMYGVFWALPAAALVTIASQNEARKRRKAAEQGSSDASDPDA